MIDAVALAIVAATPLLLAVEGELVVERSGLLNLGIEGMMLTAAMTSVLAAQLTGSVAVGFAGGIAGALLIGTLFGFFAIIAKADQIVTGTAINLLALGATGLVYREKGVLFSVGVPRVEGPAAVVFAWVAVPLLLGVILWNTTFGLRLRACGENPEAVRAAGARVASYRWAALAIESILCGVAGAYLALALSSGFAENMTAGRGFIALSIVIFGRWKLKGALLGTAVFGLTAAAQYALQASGRGPQFHLLLAAPYVVTLLIVCGIAGRVRAPEALARRKG
jgi:ABC-type uncharacterized transport system permease subunit